MMKDIVVTCDFCNTEIKQKKQYDPQFRKLKVDFMGELMSISTHQANGSEEERYDACPACYKAFIKDMDKKAKMFGQQTSEERKKEIEEIKEQERKLNEERLENLRRQNKE